MATKQNSELITQAEAARLRGVSPQAINELVERGRLNVTEIGGVKFVKRSEVLSFEPKTHKARAAKKGRGKK
jgi:hypothetical protein